MDEKRKYKRKKLWCLSDEEYLVELWAEKLPELRGNRRNGYIFNEMSAAFAGKRVEYTAEEIKVKIHNLTNKYRKEKKLVVHSGGSLSEWHLYSKIHAIFGKHKKNNIELVKVDSRPAGISSPSSPYVDENSLPSSSYASTSPPPGAAKKRRVSLTEQVTELDERIEFLEKHLFESDANYFELCRERNAILKEFVSDAKEFQRGVLQYLSK